MKELNNERMRTTTKLSHILKTHIIDVSLEGKLLKLLAFPKSETGYQATILVEGTTWSSISNQAYKKIVNK